MASLDSYDFININLGKGVDENGEFTKYKCVYEKSCSCHPETCCHFNGTVEAVEYYKKYLSGKIIYVNAFLTNKTE